MTLVCLIALFVTPSAAADSSAEHQNNAQREHAAASPLHLVASAYGTLGSYSSDTRSRALSAYITLSKDWKDYYTVGYATLWLERDDAGGKYYSQHQLTARASFLIGLRTTLFGYYAYLREGEISNYSLPATKHFAGMGGSYWFSFTEVAGGSITVSAGESKLQSGAGRGFYSYQLMQGLWGTSSLIFTTAQWTSSLLSFRQTLSISLGSDSYLLPSVELGRRGFFLDDELLVVYNQRGVLTGSYALKATIQLFDRFYAIPLIQHDIFDEYRATYVSIGLRVVY